MDYPMKSTPTEAPILDILQKRWSSLAFDPRPLGSEAIASLFEAARWAPSCYGDQPWAYIYAEKSDPMREAMESLLMEGNVWAKNAGLLIVGFGRKTFKRNDKPNDYHLYDLGAATMQLVLEATSRGLCTHQMGGFQKEKANAALDVPDIYAPGSMIDVGHPADPSKLSEALLAREKSARSRNSIDSFAFRGTFKNT